MPCQGPRDRLGIRVEEELGRIEAVPVLGLVRPVHPVAVQEAGPRLGQVDVPHLVRLLLHADPVALALRILGEASLAEEVVQKRLTTAGVVVRGSTPEAFGEHMAREFKRWNAVREAAGIAQQ